MACAMFKPGFRDAAWLCILILSTAACPFTGMAVSVSAGEDSAEQVILLTGFEPFGPVADQRPPNPSWEAVRPLHQTEWNQHRIVAHELPVIWGSPLKQLPELIQKHHPVAVFSFGQGAPGAFAIESRASKERSRILDNAGKFAAETAVVKDGPDEFQSSFQCKQMADVLTKKGYAVRVSTQAGQYLCEETLYSLEYHRRDHPEMTVAFCHVPPLGSRIGDTVVDKSYVQKFVLDYLDAWQTVSAKVVSKAEAAEPGGVVRVAATTSRSDTATVPAAVLEERENPERAAVLKLINGYFKSWSEQRMKDYGNCFADGAVIQEISSDGSLFPQLKDPFVAGQAAYHKTAVHKATEIPVKTDITFEADLARAVVYWKLTAGPRVQFGYDHFTLIREGGEWKIVNLVFYGTKEREK